MITIENADKALKTYYLDAVSAQLDSISPFYAAIEKNSREVYGKEVKIAVVRGDNTSVIAGTEDGNLPSPAQNRYINLTSSLKNIYGTIEISDKILRASQNSGGAFVDVLNAEMEGLIASARVNFSRMLYGDGNGFIATVLKYDESNNLYVDVVGRFYEGMHVDMWSVLSICDGGEDLVVTSVDYNEGCIQLSSLPEDVLPTGKLLYVHGAYGNEITGLRAIFNSTELYGCEKTGESFLKPAEFNVSALTEEAITEKIDYLEEYFNSRPNMILCSYKTKAKLAALLAQNRAQVNTTVLNGGYSAILFNDIPVVADRYCGDDSIILLNTDDFCLCQLCDWSWLEDEDGKILKQIPGKAAYSATLVKYAELICKRPCAQALIYGF